MENSLENKISFLNQNLKSKVVGDFSKYMRGIPENGLKFEEIYGTLNGINKSESQQFDIDFDLEDGFTYRNCFHDLCRNWSHTIHAQHLSVLKKPLSSITDEDAIECVKLYKNNVRGDINLVEIHELIRASQELKERIILNYWNGINNGFNLLAVFDYLRSKGYALPYMGLSAETMIEYGWIKLTS